MARDDGHLRAGQRHGRGLSDVPAGSPSTCTRSREKFFFWKPVEGMRDTLDFAGQPQPATSARRAGAAHGPDGREGDPRPRAGCAPRADAGPFHASMSAPTPYRAPAVLCCDRATCRRPRASGTRWAARARWPKALAKLARPTLAPSCAPSTEVTGFEIENGAVRGVTTASGERIACDAVISNMDAIRTYTRAGRRRAGASATPGRATSPPAPASCSISA